MHILVISVMVDIYSTQNVDCRYYIDLSVLRNAMCKPKLPVERCLVTLKGFRYVTCLRSVLSAFFCEYNNDSREFLK